MRLRAAASRLRPLTTAVVAALATVALGSAIGGYALGRMLSATAPVIATPKGVGELRLGMTIAALHERHLIGRVRKGCELAPGERAAPLRPPLRGMAIFFHPNTRLWSILVRKGAETTRHVRIGTPVSKVLNAYPHAQYVRPSENAPIPAGLVAVNRLRHPKLSFVIDPSTHRVVEIDVPYAEFCE